MKKNIDLTTYFELGGIIGDLNLEKTITTFGDKNYNSPISKITFGRKTEPSFGSPEGIQLYTVHFKNGICKDYSTMWIETEIELGLKQKSPEIILTIKNGLIQNVISNTENITIHVVNQDSETSDTIVCPNEIIENSLDFDEKLDSLTETKIFPLD